MYLLGTFGIPLFLAVNGYLMYDHDITLSYFKKKLFRYFRFILLWSVIIGAAESVIEHRFAFFDIFVGAWLGKGRLFHLWFITTILFILGLNCVVQYISKKNEKRHWLISEKWMITLVVLMNALFIINTFFFYTGDVIIAPFRLLTNGGFYLLGMYLHSQKISFKPASLICTSLVGYVGICALSITLSIKWASAMYTSIFCVIGTAAILEFCMNQSLDNHGRFWKAVQYIAPTSIGIWVLHPFVLAVLRKMLELLGFSFTLPLRVIMVPLVFVICMIVAKIALKIKGIRMLFKI